MTKKFRQIWVREDQRKFIKREAANSEKTIPEYLDEVLLKNRDDVDKELRKSFGKIF